jgi:hypothetical protein
MWVHVTLHDIVKQSVEVRLDGSRVGQLTRRMSAELLPAVRHPAEQGRTSAARAIVKGNRIKAEVVLYVARAHQLPESFLGPAGVSSIVRDSRAPICGQGVEAGEFGFSNVSAWLMTPSRRN